MSSRSTGDVPAHGTGQRAALASASWLSILGFRQQVTWRNAIAFLIHCSASILFLVFLNASQPFLIHQLKSKNKQGHGHGQPSRAGSLSGSLIFYDELLSTFMSLIWGALAELIGLAAVTSTSYVFIAIGLVAYTLPTKAWPDLLPARLVFAVGGSGATAMLSGILSEYSGTMIATRGSTEQDLGVTATSGQADAATDTGEEDRLLGFEGEEARGSPHDGSKSRQGRRHGRAAAIAGVFTGIGALIAVFVLVRLPEKIANYLEQHETATLSHDSDNKTPDDKAIHRGTVGTFYLVAALALLTASATALGLKEPKRNSRRARASDALLQRSRQRQEDYGALHDSTIAIAEDTRQARRARLRQRQQRRERTSCASLIRSHVRRFVSSSVGGFRMAGPVRRGQDAEAIKLRQRLAWELRVAYVGGALARAFTIGTTAFLPLLVTHHYYTSGLCRQLPSPNPDSPLPNDELKKLCRSAFTATAILGGTAQLTALLASPLIGLLCDTLSPTTTISLTSALGAVGFYLLGVGTSGFGGDKQTGEEVPDPLTGLSIGAAVLIGFGQIGAIVASLAGCARARGLVEEQRSAEDTRADANDVSGDARPAQEASHANVQASEAHQARQGAGAIAGAYSCTGSLSILIISKLGGFLFDMYVPSPFLLIGGFSAFVALCGAAVSIARRPGREQM
ncbi:hypothetical protein PHBOTO_000688 [Pseudozyma hubeiensis]|nr:hypothetical protein PHBOTO_000688 [Pseudozyma hubeiensis]